MPISSVYQISPVYATVSAVPGVAGAGATAAAIAAAAGGTVGGLADTIVFSRVLYTTGARGAPVVSGVITATLTGSVVLKGQPTMRIEGASAHASSEPRPMADTVLEITTSEDPGAALGAPLATNDRVLWAGFTALVVGTAIPQGSGWLTKAVLTV